MPGSREAGLVGAVLRCYPRQWRTRHGTEAAEVAVLLMRDGVPARSIAWSYLRGAARERLTLRPGRRLVAGAAAGLLAAAGSLAVALGLLSASVPASAALQPRTVHQQDAAARLVRLLRCQGLLGATVGAALPVLDASHVSITWDLAGGRAGGGTMPSRSYYVAGDRVLGPDSIAIQVTSARPAGHHDAGSHAGLC
jgi:hypothetical protein